jgi:hypothetical protein
VAAVRNQAVSVLRVFTARLLNVCKEISFRVR